MFYYVYVLESKKSEYPYVGSTPDLQRRIKEHNSGKAEYTRTYRPWKLIHYEAYRNKVDAERRERYLKTSSGKRTLHRMLKEYYQNK